MSDNTDNLHGKWEKRPDDGKGQNDSKYFKCSYCGSIGPDDFIHMIRSGAKVGGSDWKYGWPHKFYVTIPSPDPSEMREVGYTYKGDEKTTTHGTYDHLHLKFYSEHLTDWHMLSDPSIREEIQRATGIYFEVKDGKLTYKAPRFGYQQ